MIDLNCKAAVNLTAVCPWWISDTEFLSTAQDNEANPNIHRSIKHFLFASKKDNVAKRALRASRMGFAVSTPGVMCTLHRIFSKLIPREAFLYIWELMRRV